MVSSQSQPSADAQERSHDAPLVDGYEGEDDFGDECGNCGGEGGYAVCQEDCCPHIYGEEGCDDPACWRVCSECRGAGR